MSTRSQESSGASAFHRFTRELWMEFKIAADYSTGMSDPTRGTLGAPSGFVADELGFGLESPDKCGPGCRCTALQSMRLGSGAQRRSRPRRNWHALVASATKAVRAA